MGFQGLVILAIIALSSANNEYHDHHSEEVEEAIKRYSREVNLEIDEIKKKLFVRRYAGQHSLQTVSESKKYK